MRSLGVLHSSGESLSDGSTPGSVVAEIGGDHGAVVVHLPPEWWRREIEIRRVTEQWAGAHVAVLSRRLARHDDYSAFFPSLLRGDYQVRCRRPSGSPDGQEDQEVRTVSVVAGSVVDVYWGVTAAHAFVSNNGTCTPRVAGERTGVS